MQTKFSNGLVLAVSILVVVATVAGCASSTTADEESRISKDVASNENKVMVFQLPTCNCCEDYKDYLREQGFQVETTYTEDMSSIRKQYQIPPSMESCHTMVIGDYFVEGHVPIEAIKKMIEEKPDIDGIALAGMPAGSPGMAGEQTEAFKIYALVDGKTSEFMVINE
ncbi:MAG: DUF411 domain-containing protein [Dehalococcoidales bacterium]